MNEALTLPVLPLRDAVVFPGVLTPISVGRARTLKAVQTAGASDEKLLFTVAQRSNSDHVSPEGLYTIGTIARITKLQAGPGSVQLLLEGSERGIAVRFSDNEEYLEAIVKPADEMMPVNAEDPAFVALHRELRARAAELGQRAGFSESVVAQVLSNLSEPGPLTDLIASNLEIETAERQSLLETLSVEERMRRVLVHVQRQIGVLEAQEDIKSKVQRELGDRQREMVLREQLRQIQKELGEAGDGEEGDELAERLRGLDLPEEARKEVDRELKRLSRINPEAMEYQVIRTYLENVAELPWNERSEDDLDLERAAEILEEDHYGLRDVKDRVLEFLAVRQLRERREAAERARAAKESAEAEASGAEEVSGDGGAAVAPAATREGESVDGDGAPAARRPSDRPLPGNDDDRLAKGPILLFAGPPGVGKTSIARSIARAMGRRYVRISLGGARDEADIRGHRRTYVGAMPGRILQGMKQAGTRNPVFLLDEVDKLGVSYQGDPASALLEVLDPAQNDSFVDHYLGVPFDLSEVLFIATANFLESIPGPLRDRMERVDFTGYTEKEKLEIAKRYLVPRQLIQNSLTDEQIVIGDEALAETITHYTREAGVRQLEREIGRLARKVARRIAGGEIERLELGAEDVRALLGRSRIHPERAAGEDQVGVATGMYYTPVGGDIMFVEVTTMPGKGNLVLTGQLGEVMKESARAAWSYARSHAGELQIEDAGPEMDVHIHVPAGAIPKDGPSAGVTMATALISALSNRPARHDLAMTGEITLSGRILPIGGVKEKVLGATRAGITSVLLPKDNEADLEDLPEEVRDKLEVHLVERLGDVLPLAIRGEAPERDAVYRKESGAARDEGLGSRLEH